MTILWLHLRTSSIRWVIPLLVIAYLAMLLDTTAWIGSWPETAAAAQVPAFWLAPWVAALAAWSGAAPWRHGVSERLMATPRCAIAVEAPRLVATSLLLVLPFLTAQIVAAALTARSFPPGPGLFAGYTLLGASLTLVSVAVGWFAGRRFGSWTSVFAAAVLCTAVTYLGQQGGGLLVAGRPQQTVRWQGTGVRLVLTVSLLVAVLWATPAVRRWTGWVSIAVLGTVLGLVVAAGVPVAARSLTEQDATCVAGRLRLCLWPEHEKYLPLVRSVGDRAARLPAAFTLPPVAVENGIRLVAEPAISPSAASLPSAASPAGRSPARAVFAVRDGSVWSAAGDLAEVITQRTVDAAPSCPGSSPTGTTAPADWTHRVRLVAWLEAYLAGGGSPDYHDDASAEIRQVQAEGRRIANDTPREQQFTWAAAELAQVAHRCG